MGNIIRDRLVNPNGFRSELVKSNNERKPAMEASQIATRSRCSGSEEKVRVTRYSAMRLMRVHRSAMTAIHVFVY